MTGSVRTFERGIALIVEGATEKMFYQVYLERCCDACPPAHMDKELLDGDVCFVIRGCSHGERLVMFHSMDTITQMPNAGAWSIELAKGSSRLFRGVFFFAMTPTSIIIPSPSFVKATGLGCVRKSRKVQKTFSIWPPKLISKMFLCAIMQAFLPGCFLRLTLRFLQAGTARISFADCFSCREDVAPIMQESVLEGSLNRSIWRRSKRRSLSIWAS